MSQFSLLASRRFLPLFCTQFLGALNDNIYKNALVIFITFTLADRTLIDSTILVVMAGGIFILPYFLFSAAAGQLADRRDKACLIRRIKLAEIFIMSFAIAGFITQSVFVLMAVLFLMGTQSAFFGPLKYGILPQHLQVRELIGGNGMVQMGTYIAILGGTITGGVVIAIDAYGTLFVSVLVVLVAVAGWIASRYIPPAPPAEDAAAPDWNIFRLSCRILAYAWSNRGIFTLMIAISWFWFIGATYLSLVPAYTRDVLLGDELVTTLLLTAFSVGIGSGSLLCERLARGEVEPGLVPVGALGLSVFAVDLFMVGAPGIAGVTAPLGPAAFLQFGVHWRVLFDLTAIGFFGGIYIVPLYALIQHRSVPEHRARVIAANNILNALFMVVSALLVMGLVSAGLDIPQIFLLVALLNLLICGALFAASAEFLHRLRRLTGSARTRGTNHQDKKSGSQ